MMVHFGVTGHRHLADPGAVAEAVDAVLDTVIPIGHADPVVVISALAEGADRLVVDRVLARPPATIRAILPLPIEDYRTDFPATAAAFDGYLAIASQIEVTHPRGSTRDEAYEAAGRRMVEASDLLLAVWDGRPAAGRGGTAEIVEYARTLGVEVRVIAAQRAAESSDPTSEASCS